MRRAAMAQRGGTARMATAPAPYGGWNTRDSLSTMPPEDAPILDNFFPGVGGVRSRRGYSLFSTSNATGAIETIAEFNSSGTQKMLIAGGGTVNVVDDAGALGSALGSGYASNRWQTASMNARLLLVNGADTPKYYDGTTWADNTFTGSGLTPANLIGLHVYRYRLYAWEANKPWFWYGSASASSGALVKFDLTFIAKMGGSVTCIKSITRDGGAGPDDQLAIYMSTGEVLIYTGSDPGTAAEFSQIGRYVMPPPLSIRSFVEYKGDVLAITTADIISTLQVASESGFVNNPSKLSGAVKDAAEDYSANYGWQATLYPAGNQIIFNIPVSPAASHQYVTNTITGAACRFKGMNARCWGTYKGNLYFAQGLRVYRADTGLTDNSGIISVDAQHAYVTIGGRGRKRFTQFRPYVKADGDVQLTLKTFLDYGTQSGRQETPTTSVTTSPWDTSPWDTTSWSAEEAMRLDPYAMSGTGSAVSTRVQADLNGQSLEWFQTDYGFVPVVKF